MTFLVLWLLSGVIACVALSRLERYDEKDCRTPKYLTLVCGPVILFLLPFAISQTRENRKEMRRLAQQAEVARIEREYEEVLRLIEYDLVPVEAP